MLGASKPDLARHLVDAANVTIGFYGDVCESCVEVTNACLCPSPETIAVAPTLYYILDQYSESADAQEVEIQPSTFLGGLTKTDLSLVDPPAALVGPTPVIPSLNVRITTVGVSGLIFISLIDLTSSLTGIPEGIYVGTVADGSGNVIATLKVTFATVVCP
jgi:hypothetical protein